MAKVDYVIRNGRVIDPFRGIDKTMDIAVKNGEIVSADNADGTEVDAGGCLVVPGLIDFHCHVGAYVTDLGIPPETSYLPTGVTTVVDAGSTGTANYEAFRRLTLCSRLRIKAFLNVCPAGLVTIRYHENLDPAVFDRDRMLRFMKKYSDQLLGFKIRSSSELVGEKGLEPFMAMMELAEQAGCPVAVHTTNPPAETEEIARRLRPGDVYAHVFQGKGHTVIRDGKVIEELRGHQKRGVIFDAANGVNHFGLKVARACLDQGFLPDIISTDLSVKSVYAPGKVFSLPFIMSKYIALGMEIPEIIRRVTTNPARALGEEKELGSLMEGTCADIAILRVVDKPVDFMDFAGDSVHGEKLFRTEMTIREGQTAFRQIEF